MHNRYSSPHRCDHQEMHPVDALEHLGGLGSHSTLRRYCTRRQLEGAVADGLILRTARGSYALSGVGEGPRLAHATNGVLCLASAALAHGWAVKRVPERPQICYPRYRRLKPQLRAAVEARWVDLDPGDVDGHATARGKTLEMCGRSLPFDEALAIADSALRHGELATLTALRHIQGRGAARVKRMVTHASGLAANPFESVLRAIAVEVRDLNLIPQVRIGKYRPDLVDENLRIVAEADSFEWHGGRAALRRDADRYNELVTRGWLVLRFSWEDVMYHPEDVRRTLERAVLCAKGLTKPGGSSSSRG